ncbi:TlpA disulfide reductase family protein [Flavobacterium noncentrifugens]|uniref:AhpC/TSA family protein n=1 Tax=Flavobacterium noncentrifugens TaxID=1128970 RepID=A0A1G8W623_9FLAO|nr:TlpA disulfide reductase family protein [Flavobacterium noncentrifugens]SDJ73732.1 AhpC/TSA family protein [Flavobacterium noncentrifugens]
MKLLFSLLILFLMNCVSLTAQTDPKPLKVYSKDGISVKSYDYKTFEYFLNQKNDTTYVVNFWATWCKPCVEELPNFEKLNAEYKSKKVKVILVSMDMSKQVETSLLPFIKRKNLQSKVIFLNDPDANSWIEKVDKSWSGAIPATVIYNKSQRKFYEQSFTFEALEKEVQSIIQ